ncbi:hypothetical protein FKM82_010257 [Ascaphus truei]|uniref:tubulin-specific chaperone C n=1 Tax=Ascaphus truei TaxID=8439 RepID=UPI003F591EB6
MEADGDSLERHGRLPERLQKREQDRQRDAERKRQEKEGQVVLEEKSGYFRDSFGPEREAIDELLTGNGGGEEPGALEEVSARLQVLQKLLNDSMMFLPPYDIRQAQDTLTRLQAALEGKRQLLQPKKKFAFKSRRKAAAPASDLQPPGVGQPDASDLQPPAPGVSQPDPSSSAAVCDLQGLTGQVLRMEAAELRQKDVLLSQLRDCTITLRGSPATLHLRGLRDCRLLCGPVSSSVLVDGCSGCVFAFPCQQLRAHSSSDTRFYLHVTSRAIIEDCRGLSFAPFSWSYEGIGQDYEASGLDRDRNNWSTVDDFNWLARGAVSPNWSVIPEEDRITRWN